MACCLLGGDWLLLQNHSSSHPEPWGSMTPAEGLDRGTTPRVQGFQAGKAWRRGFSGSTGPPRALCKDSSATRAQREVGEGLPKGRGAW